MDAPKCKLCGQRHYGLCAKGGDAPAHKQPAIDKPPAVSPAPTAGGKPKFDRNAYHRAYMRDYMRKRRAKERQK